MISDAPDEFPEPNDYSPANPIYNVYEEYEPQEDDAQPCSCTCGCTSLTYGYICPACEHGDHAD